MHFCLMLMGPLGTLLIIIMKPLVKGRLSGKGMGYRFTSESCLERMSEEVDEDLQN